MISDEEIKVGDIVTYVGTKWPTVTGRTGTVIRINTGNSNYKFGIDFGVYVKDEHDRTHTCGNLLDKNTGFFVEGNLILANIDVGDLEDDL